MENNTEELIVKKIKKQQMPNALKNGSFYIEENIDMINKN